MENRDYFFDNAKFILIFLVVTGHFIEKYIQPYNFAFGLHNFIYLFHMPAFALISGYFSKDIRNIKKKILYKLFPPYIIFQLIYCFILKWTIIDMLTVPCWIMWFLLILIIWNAMLPVFIKFKRPIILSIVLSIIPGYVFQGGVEHFVILKTFAFFPFFLFGYYLKRQFFESLSTNKVKLTSLIIVVVLFALTVCNFLRLDPDWLLRHKPFATMGYTGLYAGIYYYAIFAITSVLIICFLSLVPRNKTFFSVWGSRTIYVYLLHGLVLKLLELLGLYAPNTNIVLVIIGIVFLTIFLSSNIVYKLTEPLIEPYNYLQSLWNFLTKQYLYFKSDYIRRYY